MKNSIIAIVHSSNQEVLKAIKACGYAQVARAGFGDGSLTILQNVINDLYVANEALNQATKKLQDWN